MHVCISINMHGEPIAKEAGAVAAGFEFDRFDVAHVY